ncbi:MAG: hypothetical protein ACE5DO_07720 [Desulfobacterales bacterium]
MSNNGTCIAGFAGQNIEIGYNNLEAKLLIDFLLGDLQVESSVAADTRYDVLVVGRPPKVSLWQGDKQLYFGNSKHTLAYILINEMIHRFIVDHKADLAIHAAAFSCNNTGILIPGKSGSGKSTLAAWLTAKGFNYLTDELIFLSNNGVIKPLIRPISLHYDSLSAVDDLVDPDEAQVLAGQRGVMVSHRVLNTSHVPCTPVLSRILFPKYQHGFGVELKKLSSAKSCFKLIECHVNARNMPGHGFGQLAALTRQTESYQLTYGGFDGLFDRLRPILFDDK